jgi:hypothetical protein
MSDWGIRGREYYQLRVVNFDELASWIRLHSIDIDYIDQTYGNQYTLETQLAIGIEVFDFTCFWIDCAEPRYDGGELRKLHQFLILRDLIF